MSDYPELLPCPFCGGPGQITNGAVGCCFIRCEGCNATSDDRSRDAAIRAWNTRADRQQRAQAEPSQAAADVIAERERQIAVEGWQPIETAPNFERVITAEWIPPLVGKRPGYWSVGRDIIIDGKPYRHRTATLWHPYPPTAPQEDEGR